MPGEAEGVGCGHTRVIWRSQFELSLFELLFDYTGAIGKMNNAHRQIIRKWVENTILNTMRGYHLGHDCKNGNIHHTFRPCLATTATSLEQYINNLIDHYYAIYLREQHYIAHLMGADFTSLHGRGASNIVIWSQSNGTVLDERSWTFAMGPLPCTQCPDPDINPISEEISVMLVALFRVDLCEKIACVGTPLCGDLINIVSEYCACYNRNFIIECVYA